MRTFMANATAIIATTIGVLSVALLILSGVALAA
jgi:hypothetical protein